MIREEEGIRLESDRLAQEREREKREVEKGKEGKVEARRCPSSRAPLSSPRAQAYEFSLARIGDSLGAGIIWLDYITMLKSVKVMGDENGGVRRGEERRRRKEGSGDGGSGEGGRFPPLSRSRFLSLLLTFVPLFHLFLLCLLLK